MSRHVSEAEREVARLHAEAKAATDRARQAQEAFNKTPEGKAARALDLAESWDFMADDVKAATPEKKAEWRAKAQHWREQAQKLLADPGEIKGGAE